MLKPPTGHAPVLGPFVQEKMQWASYTESMEESLLAKDVDNAQKKVAVLLSTVYIAR